MGYVKAFMWLGVFAAAVVTALMLPETPVDFINITGTSEQVQTLARFALVLVASGSVVATIINVLGGSR